MPDNRKAVLRNRRRIARPRAAWHLIRHGSLIYGVHFVGGVHIKEMPRPLLVQSCFVEHPEQID